MSASVDIQPFLRGLQQAGEKQLAAASAALLEFAAHVAGDSAQLSPVDTGFLQNSATWGDVVVAGDAIYVEVGHNASYAAAVHERLDVHHDIGQAKYLETALRNNAPKLGPFVAAKVKGAAGG